MKEWFYGKVVGEPDRATVLPAWVYVGVIFALLWMVYGCAKPELPECEEIEAGMVVLNGSVYTTFSTPQVEKLLERMRNLQNGVCRLPYPMPKGKEV
jgi:hypothetical protein